MDHFLFQPGEWKGSGAVTFSHSPESLDYTLRWKIEQNAEGLKAEQEVAVDGVSSMRNCYSIIAQKTGSFLIILTNEVLGTFSGSGVVQDEKIAWEFEHPGQLEGLEAYERITQDEYVFHAEYSGGDGFVTKISGSLVKM